MRIVRGPDVEAVWTRCYPGEDPEGFEPYDTGETTIEMRILLNRFETRLLREWQRANSAWFEAVVVRVLRLQCRLLRQHNVSCRGRSGHHGL